MSARQILIEIYLDYINNYLTIARYAECNEMYEDQAQKLINLAEQVYNSTHPEA